MELKKWNISNLESLAFGRVLTVCYNSLMRITVSYTGFQHVDFRRDFAYFPKF